VLRDLVQHKIEAGPNIITGLAVSLQAAAVPVTVIAAAMWFAYSMDGVLYGVTVAAAAMLSMAGIVFFALPLAIIGAFVVLAHVARNQGQVCVSGGPCL
jgi:Na+/H+-translocating membrane pyrophosphatase